MTKKRFDLLLTEDQLKILEAKSRAAGFYNKSEYIRFVIFSEVSTVEKINAIYSKVMQK